MQEDTIIKNAQYRKGLSIAFFNANNNATKIAELEGVEPRLLKDRITFWRDWLLEEHKKYYANVIENIGLNYDANETIMKLQEAENLERLQSIWVSLSEDERQDKKIIEVKNKLKEQYAKN